MLVSDLRATFDAFLDWPWSHPCAYGVLTPLTVAAVHMSRVIAVSSPNAKPERVNLRLSTDALETIKEAARVQGQDVTSFMTGAALDRARAVLAEDRLLRLTPHEVNQLETALDKEPAVVPQLMAVLRRFGLITRRSAKGSHAPG